MTHSSICFLLHMFSAVTLVLFPQSSVFWFYDVVIRNCTQKFDALWWEDLNIWVLIMKSGMIFFSVILLISAIFPVKKKDENCSKLSEQLQNDLSERGCRWFQLFHFLIRIISLILKCTDWFSFHTRFNNCIRRFMLSDLLKHIKIKLIFQQLNKNNTTMKPDTPFDLSRWELSILILLLILWLYHIFFLEKSMYIVL